MKAHTASFKDLYYAIGIMLDKMEKLSRINNEQQTSAPDGNLYSRFQAEPAIGRSLVE